MELYQTEPKTKTQEAVFRVINCFWGNPVTVDEIVKTAASEIDSLIKDEVERQLKAKAEQP